MDKVSQLITCMLHFHNNTKLLSGFAYISIYNISSLKKSILNDTTLHWALKFKRQILTKFIITKLNSKRNSYKLLQIRVFAIVCAYSYKTHWNHDKVQKPYPKEPKKIDRKIHQNGNLQVFEMSSCYNDIRIYIIPIMIIEISFLNLLYLN